MPSVNADEDQPMNNNTSVDVNTSTGPEEASIDTNGQRIRVVST